MELLIVVHVMLPLVIGFVSFVSIASLFCCCLYLMLVCPHLVFVFLSLLLLIFFRWICYC